jgi:hypothetical protein
MAFLSEEESGKMDTFLPPIDILLIHISAEPSSV